VYAFLILAALLAAVSIAAAAEREGPLPPEIVAGAPELASACQTRLADGVAVFQSLPPIVDNGACGAMDAVRLEAILLPDNIRIPLRPPAVLHCTMAEAIARWVREDVAPAASRAGARLQNLDNFAAYECRSRNRVAGAKISEHGFGGALDVRAVALTNGLSHGLANPAVPRAFREAMRGSACARFTTVLGPGADGYHEDHVHLDLAQRRGGFRLCQWDIRDLVPVPRPRPDFEAEHAAAEAE
jgi:hypothetical protein